MILSLVTVALQSTVFRALGQTSFSDIPCMIIPIGHDHDISRVKTVVFMQNMICVVSVEFCHKTTLVCVFLLVVVENDPLCEEHTLHMPFICSTHVVGHIATNYLCQEDQFCLGSTVDLCNIVPYVTKFTFGICEHEICAMESPWNDE